MSIGYVFPFVWMISTSLKTLDKTMAYPPVLIPDKVEMHNAAMVIPADGPSLGIAPSGTWI